MRAADQPLVLGTDDRSIGQAADLLAAGRLVAFPTETVYGLGADATDALAVARIYEAKGRPRFNPLIAHMASLAQAQAEALFSDKALRLAERFWPGPLTLVLPRAPGGQVSEIARAGLDSVAVRVPGHPHARALIERLGRPLAGPSANRSGHVSPTTPAHVLADLAGRLAAVVDGGPARVGVESTILSCLDDRVRLLRPGGLARGDIERLLGEGLADPEPGSGDAPLAPGLLGSHYAPEARVRLEAERPDTGEAWLGFGADPDGLADGPTRLNLSPEGDLVEAAANLFGMLRRLDAAGVAGIAVAAIPGHGLGEAILDRLRRAAAPRVAGG